MDVLVNFMAIFGNNKFLKNMIGLLTFQLTNNFGAHLHTIALYNKIKDLGYTCEIVDYRSPELINRETKSFRLVGLSPKR